MSDTVIKVDNLSKKYILSHQSRERYTALRDVMARAATNLGKKLTSPLAGHHSQLPSSKEEFFALKDVSFEIKQGDRIGIIGRNGAGKSTLLKVLSRIIEPTSGKIEITGRVASLLEVGTGFHPELTGRENIFLNGAILGMRKAEIKRKFDEIVDFAEIEKFLDTPVKRYSSGMYVRLAFAVAAHLEPEILIVDEVLAVGDAQFQKKCLGKMGEVSKGGRTVLFVSHNMAAVNQLCNLGVLLQSGSVKAYGECSDVVSAYMARSVQSASDGLNHYRIEAKAGTISITDLTLLRNGHPVDEVVFGDQISLEIGITAERQMSFSVELILRDELGHPIAFSPSGLTTGEEFNARKGKNSVLCNFPPIDLAQGGYSLDVMLANPSVCFYDYLESPLKFQVLATAIGKLNWQFKQSGGQGCFLWHVKFVG